MLNNIISDLAYFPLLNEVKGKRLVMLHKPYGNIGDTLLIEATRQMFRRHQIRFVECDPTNMEKVARDYPDIDIMVYGPGGNVSGRYKTKETVEALFSLSQLRGSRFICFPQSVENWYPHLLYFDKIYLRDKTSLKIASFAGANAEMVPDMGLNYRVHFPIPTATNEEGFFPRQDAEKLEVREEYKDPTDGIHTVEEYIKLAAMYKRITTDRLHFAIAGILAGRDVTLVRNDYHKNESIYNSYLHLYCKFAFNM